MKNITVNTYSYLPEEVVVMFSFSFLDREASASSRIVEKVLIKPKIHEIFIYIINNCVITRFFLQISKIVENVIAIDFVANKSDKRYYIQSCYKIDDKLDQETRPLLKLNDGYKKIIIVKDGLTPHYNNDGILILDLFDFLLEKDSLIKY